MGFRKLHCFITGVQFVDVCWIILTSFVEQKMIRIGQFCYNLELGRNMAKASMNYSTSFSV